MKKTDKPESGKKQPKKGTTSGNKPRDLPAGERDARARRSLPLLDPKMLELLVCPQCKGPLVFDEAAQELVSKQAKLAYPVRDGVPLLVISQARPLDD